MEKEMNTEIIGEIKRRLIDILTDITFSDDHLEEMEIKRKVWSAIGDNFFDERFRIETLEDAIAKRYKIDRLEMLKSIIIDKEQLWRTICINASHHSAIPDSIANAAVISHDEMLNKLKIKHGK